MSRSAFHCWAIPRGRFTPSWSVTIWLLKGFLPVRRRALGKLCPLGSGVKPRHERGSRFLQCSKHEGGTASDSDWRDGSLWSQVLTAQREVHESSGGLERSNVATTT